MAPWRIIGRNMVDFWLIAIFRHLPLITLMQTLFKENSNPNQTNERTKKVLHSTRIIRTLLSIIYTYLFVRMYSTIQDDIVDIIKSIESQQEEEQKRSTPSFLHYPPTRRLLIVD